jgi:acyl-CoA thioester hydrolase
MSTRAAPPDLASFPIQSQDKLRYGDTDRQGHVNNAVFSTFLETGRVEMLQAQGEPILDQGCSFVIASLQLDYLNEVTWPGTVEIGTGVERVGSASVTLRQAVFQQGVCVANGRTIVVQVNNETRRSQPLSQEAVSRLHAFISPA